jgi:endogenous inhibitor of DNA gyrase (YacG/DUF329 family)
MPLREPCVYCRRRDADARFRPFCSERCKLADLGHWLSGDYQVAGPAAGSAPREGATSDDDDSVDDTLAQR